MSIPERIVTALLESDEEDPKDYIDYVEGEDPKDFLDRQGNELFEDKWEQIGGDYGDPWEYGGSWLNQHRGMIIHINGLEGEGLHEFGSDDIELSDEEMVEINNQFPVFVDPDFPEEGDQNERDRDEAVENLKQERADAANDTRKLPVYEFSDEPIREDEWAEQLAAVRQQWDDPNTLNGLPSSAIWLELGQYMGFDELDCHPEPMTKQELEAKLGFGLR